MTPDPTPDAPVVPTLTLAGFVEARLDEDRAAASIPEGLTVLVGSYFDGPIQPHAIEQHTCDEYASPYLVMDAARVLASVEADRRILAPHIPDREHPDPWAHDVCPACTTYGAYDHTVVYEDECDTLRALASKWATHPDWSEDWRP